MLTSNPLSSPALKPVVLLLQHHMQVPPWLVRCVLNLANVILVFIEFFYSGYDIGNFIWNLLHHFLFAKVLEGYLKTFSLPDILLEGLLFQRILTSMIQNTVIMNRDLRSFRESLLRSWLLKMPLYIADKHLFKN